MKKFVFLIAIASVILFQNCGVPFSAQSGNGNGYGGYKIGDGSAMPIVSLNYRESAEVACSDGSFVQSLIVYSNSTAVMIRENCADLPQALVLDPKEVSLSGDLLYYRGRMFRSEN